MGGATTIQRSLKSKKIFKMGQQICIFKIIYEPLLDKKLLKK